MNRRNALSLTVLGLASIPACRERRPVNRPTSSSPETPVIPHHLREGSSLIPVEVDPSLEIRSIAGLRPFRSSGFVVRKESLGEKTVIHNYGHGGGGITLSWGSSQLAVKLAESVAGKSCAILGGGVMGLSTARLLQLQGANVTIYTSQLPPNTTSNVAGAQWWPFSVFDNHRRTDEFGAQYVEAARFSFEYFQRLVGPKWGVRWLPNYYLSTGEPTNGWIAGPGGVLHDLQIGFKDFGPGEHIFPDQYARRFSTMMIEPSVYLPTLLDEIQGAGGKVEIRHFNQLSELQALPETLLFNCTGIGSGKLFPDPELIPIKGQLTILIPQSGVDYNLISNNYYMFPRADGIILGGTYQKNQWNTEPDPVLGQDILRGHAELFAGMKRVQNGGAIEG